MNEIVNIRKIIVGNISKMILVLTSQFSRLGDFACKKYGEI